MKYRLPSDSRTKSAFGSHYKKTEYTNYKILFSESRRTKFQTVTWIYTGRSKPFTQK
ncbi:hypothetical protein LEP1GSC166_3755 [Leptospira kirschneri]|nr:hypothetical protein LEP1GSC198_3199 [Leptospira kirschneri str. JB]EMK06434.1 hypothetical protein LEP1GSC166_3755 [Leptospira kirschneri]